MSASLSASTFHSLSSHKLFKKSPNCFKIQKLKKIPTPKILLTTIEKVFKLLLAFKTLQNFQRKKNTESHCQGFIKHTKKNRLDLYVIITVACIRFKGHKTVRFLQKLGNKLCVPI